ncbi:hypothetical protein HMPREF1531_01051 [Propionibacterium sp. oral taxon 192 str. F0372]|uniref:polymorphic toxin type 24 domain-containing protein n=1 Tax=Propionibacterium sp. oral taxon 192 TaxID=671222 RepID=UPI000354722F|nr:polymorphic toxin type 24 domain-containing protein [Propionibacterium sp. oral taxon 192]EPH05622.1 hypothetical protein HMPREF1531_01051 [Propionibacterium sp. oral taxon 192 str. F0372]
MACIDSYNTVVSLLDGLGVELAATVDKLCRAAIQVLDKRPIHSSPDRVTLPEDMKPISERLPGAQENPNNKDDFPDITAPGTVYVRTNPATGEILQYATYGDDGYITKRVDLQGAAHYDKLSGREIPTPHVVYYQKNTNSRTNEVYIKKDSSTVREAYPEEIP